MAVGSARVVASVGARNKALEELHFHLLFKYFHIQDCVLTSSSNYEQKLVHIEDGRILVFEMAMEVHRSNDEDDECYSMFLTG